MIANIERFEIAISDQVLNDLRARVLATRWPDDIDEIGWEAGTNLDYLKDLMSYWANQFDWRAQERYLNSFPQVMVDVEGTRIHAIRLAGNGNAPRPLLLLHGWPDSFWRMTKIVPMLADPVAYGGSVDDAFDVIVPSIPGFGFSERPMLADFNGGWVADRLVGLMHALGYDRFGIQGGDLGAGVAEWIAHRHPQSVSGMHLTNVPFWHNARKPDDLTEEEQRYFDVSDTWRQSEGAYAQVHSTKPLALAVGLNDSPSGLAAWIVQQFRAWSDCNGDVESRFSKDDLLTNLTIYWVTHTVGSSFRLYYASRHQPSIETDWPLPVPTGIALFPKEIVQFPREWAGRFYDVRHWSEMPRGGHFAAFEEPALLAEDLRTFFRSLQNSGR